jgi:limonene-1,2-epoxide hydrolase
VTTNSETVRAFIDAFNSHDLDAFAMTLHPEVELHAGRGVRVGVELARLWATRTPGGVQQQILVEELHEAGDRVLALIVREWWWDEEEEAGTEPAHAEEMAWLFEIRDGLISTWRPFDDRGEALTAFAAV